MTSFATRPRYVCEKRERNAIIRMFPRFSWCVNTRTRYSKKVVGNLKRECGIRRIPLVVLEENDDRERGERREGDQARNVYGTGLKGIIWDRERNGRIIYRRAEVRRKERRKGRERVENTTG